MIDLKGIEALYQVLSEQSFEKAAQSLHLSQPAISQRIKSLEAYYGGPLITRSLPYKATEIGAPLICFYKQTKLLESTLDKQIQETKQQPRLSIATNRDSLETWLLDSLTQYPPLSQLEIELIADDQELTFHYFKQGLCTHSISTSKQKVAGAQVSFLGPMDYLLVSTPKFKEAHFKSGLNPESLKSAPCLKFDKDDTVNESYFERFYSFSSREGAFHMVPSVEGFRRFALCSYGYGLIPEIDIKDELKSKELIILSKHKWQIPLYLHSWELDSKPYQDFSDHIRRYAQSLFLDESLSL